MPIFEFVCKTSKCCNEVQEHLVSSDEVVLCNCCNQPLNKILSPTKGLVRGTRNPVKFKSKS